MLIDLYERNPFCMGMIGIGAGLSAKAISALQQLDLVIRVAGGFVALLVGLTVLILQGHKLLCLSKNKKWFGLSVLAAMVATLLAFSGCSAVPVRMPTVSSASISVLTATTSNAKAIASSAAAHETLTTARAKASQLALSASQEQKPVLKELSDSLDAANMEIVNTQTDLTATGAALTESAQRVDNLQQQLADTATSLDASRKAENTMKAARDFWRGVTWKLGLLALGLGLWTFRKPILALTGVPTWLPV